MALDTLRRRRRWLFVVGGLVALTTLAARWRRTLPHTRNVPAAPTRP